MSWSENRSRPIRREVTFTEDEWKRTQRLYKELTRYAPQHRSFASYARRMLSERRIHVHEIKPLTDPEPLAREIGRIGVNVSWIAHWANRNERITPEQVEEVTASFHRVEELLGRLFEDKREARTGGMSSRTAQAGRAAELSDLVLCLLGQCTNRVYHARYD